MYVRPHVHIICDQHNLTQYGCTWLKKKNPKITTSPCAMAMCASMRSGDRRSAVRSARYWCVAVYYRVLQCVAVRCSVLDLEIAVVPYEVLGTDVLQCAAMYCSVLQCIAVCCSVLQCAAVCCSVLQCVAECCSVWQCIAVHCSVLRCVAVCCSVLQCVVYMYISGHTVTRHFCRRTRE